MSNKFIYNAIDCSTYGGIVLDDEISGATAEYDVVKIAGKSGDLHLSKNRFSNRNRMITVFFGTGAKANLSSLDNKLLAVGGYAKLSSTLYPNEYMMAEYKGGVSSKKNVGFSVGRAVFEFDCKPQIYLTSGDTETTYSDSSVTITNPTDFESKPLIKVTQGTGTLQVGSYSVTINTSHADMVIDCETEDVYGSTAHANYNADVTIANHKFPRLKAGNNGITIPSGMVIKVTPRWWKL